MPPGPRPRSRGASTAPDAPGEHGGGRGQGRRDARGDEQTGDRVEGVGAHARGIVPPRVGDRRALSHRRALDYAPRPCGSCSCRRCTPPPPTRISGRSSPSSSASSSPGPRVAPRGHRPSRRPADEARPARQRTPCSPPVASGRTSSTPTSSCRRGRRARSRRPLAGAPLVVTAHGTDVANAERSAVLRAVTRATVSARRARSSRCPNTSPAASPPSCRSARAKTDRHRLRRRPRACSRPRDAQEARAETRVDRRRPVRRVRRVARGAQERHAARRRVRPPRQRPARVRRRRADARRRRRPPGRPDHGSCRPRRGAGLARSRRCRRPAVDRRAVRAGDAGGDGDGPPGPRDARRRPAGVRPGRAPASSWTPGAPTTSNAACARRSSCRARTRRRAPPRSSTAPSSRPRGSRPCCCARRVSRRAGRAARPQPPARMGPARTSRTRRRTAAPPGPARCRSTPAPPESRWCAGATPQRPPW